MPNHYVGDGLHTIGISGLSRVRTELLRLAVVTALTPHPVQMHGQLSRHCDFGDLASTPHAQMKKPVAPLRLTAHRDLRRFHQQKPEEHVALFADVSQPAPISARLLLRHQPDIAGQLLAAVETLRSSNHQLVRQCRQRADSGMRHQQPRYWTLLHFVFQRARQLLDLRRQLVEQFEQVLPPSAGPWRQRDRLQFLASRRPPQRFLAPQTFVQRNDVQLIHHSRVHLHQSMPMPQQLPQIMKRLGHCSLDVTLAYLRGREAEGEQEQNFANQSALALYA
jgi:hypothetical protein